MKTYQLTFLIAACSKERPRFARRGKKTITYTAPKTRSYENSIKTIARAQLLGKVPAIGILEATMRFVFKKPKTTKLLFPRPDVDNLAKALADSLNQVLYEDDTLIASLHASKHWGKNDRIELILTELESWPEL